MFRFDKNFHRLKGKLIESAVRSEAEDLFSNSELLSNCFASGINGELDLAVVASDFSIGIESKSASYRNSSSDMSHLNAMSDLKPLLRGLEQINPFLELFSNGGTLFVGKRRTPHTIRGNRTVIGAIITDDIYTTISLDAVNVKAAANVSARATLQCHPIWIGSIFDLRFLLLVSQTPSLFLHYVINFRSRPFSHLLEEADSWFIYSKFLEFPFSFITVEDQLVADDYLWTNDWWELLRCGKMHVLTPSWIKQDLDRVKSLDSLHKTKEALDLVDLNWSVAVCEFRSKYVQVGRSLRPHDYAPTSRVSRHTSWLP